MGIRGRELQNVFDTLPGLYLILMPDKPQFTIAAVSDSYAAATMIKREEIIGKGLFEVFPDNPNDPNATGVAKLTASLEKVLQNKKPHRMATQKYDIRRPGGEFEVRYWSPINTPVIDENDKITHIIHCVTDITKTVEQSAKQQQAEQEIENLLQRHNTLFEQDYVALAVFRGKDYIIEQANPLLLQIWGRTKAQVINKPLFKALPEVEGQGLEELLNGVLTSGNNFVGRELPIKLKRKGKLDTVYFDFVYVAMRDSRGSISGITVLATDATSKVLARDQMEKAKSEAEAERQRLDDLFMQAPAMIAILRGRNHIFELANPLYLKVSAKSKKIIGKSVPEVFPELKGQGVLELLDNIYRSGEAYIGNEVLVKLDRKGDGTLDEVYFNFVYQPFKNAKGETEGILVHGIEVTEQVKARKLVEESEASLKLALEAGKMGVWHLDLEHDITKRSLEHDQIFGYKSSVPKWGLEDFINSVVPEDKDRVYKEFHDSLQHGELKFDCKIKRADNKLAWIHVRGKVFYENNKPIRVSGLVMDITEHKKTEAALKRSEERFRVLIEKSSDVIALSDEKGNYTYVSPGIKKMLGYSPKEFIKLNGFDLMHTDELNYIRQKYKKLLSNSGNSETIELRARHKNGSCIWVEATARNLLNDSRIDAIVSNIRDITERKKAEENIKRSEERWKFMAESMPQKVFTTKANGKSDYLSPQWMKYTGLSYEKIKGWGWLKVIHPDDRQETELRWKKCLETGEPYEQEHRFLRHDGTYRWNITRAYALNDEQGNIILWIGSSTDIEDIKRTLSRQHELEGIAAALEQQRTELLALNHAKDEFISLASHQLRTPATGVKQYISLLLDEYAGEISTTQRKFLETANESNERQLKIVNDLLKVAQIDAGKVKLHKENIDMVHLIEEVIEEQASKFTEKNQKITFRHTKNNVLAEVDKGLFRMVLENLIDNANKYTYSDKNIEVKLANSKGKIRISVKDEGAGINKQDQAKLFFKFSRIDNPLSVSAAGTGLGLYWVKKILDLHNAVITVESAPGIGSEFMITLPRTTQQ